MNVLILGANGYMGPHVVKKLAPHHRLRITDIRPAPDAIRQQYGEHDFRQVDVTDFAQVHESADGVDAIINLSVVRQDPVLAFRVNTLGCYHVMRTAVERNIRRVINTGPHFTVAGPTYESWDFAITPDVPPHPGTGLYPLSKSLGQEISRVFADHHDVLVIELLFYMLQATEELKVGAGGVPFVVSWDDAAEAFRLSLEVDPAQLPSRCEVFFIAGDLPQQKFLNQKAKRLLGFTPRDDVSVLWWKNG